MIKLRIFFIILLFFAGKAAAQDIIPKPSYHIVNSNKARNNAAPQQNPYENPDYAAYQDPNSASTSPYAPQDPNMAGNPYSEPSMGANPYGDPSAAGNPYANAGMGENPYAEPSMSMGGNPYGAPTMAAPGGSQMMPGFPGMPSFPNPFASTAQNSAVQAPASADYEPYQQVGEMGSMGGAPENLFGNPNYVPDQDPSLFADADMPDQAPVVVASNQADKAPVVNVKEEIDDVNLVTKSNNPRATLFSPQKQTPSRIFSADLSKPEVFVNSSNLIRKTGSFYQARGEVISIEGKVTDSFGVPIQGAVIEIWQANAAGKYQNLLEKNSRFLDIYFNMSGRAITDNLANYSFLTIMPGSYLDRAPHINMNIHHEQFGRIETEFYFDKHPKNELDYQYLSYKEEDRKLLTAEVDLANRFNKDSHKRVYFNIVMSGVHKYKSFGSTF